MKPEALQQNVTDRIVRYIDILNKLVRQGKSTVTANIMASFSMASATTVRRDLAIFGVKGITGKGYSIYQLLDYLPKLLGLDRVWKIILIGASGYGIVLVKDTSLAMQGIEISLIFDDDPKLIGSNVGAHIVRDLDSLEERITGKGIRLAALASPNISAQEITNRLVQVGVKGILNFTQQNITVPENVCFHHLSPVLHLQQLISQISIN